MKALKKIRNILIALLPALIFHSCLNVEPKVLGQGGKLDFSALAGGVGAFSFKFALTSANDPGDRLIDFWTTVQKRTAEMMKDPYAI